MSNNLSTINFSWVQTNNSPPTHTHPSSPPSVPPYCLPPVVVMLLGLNIFRVLAASPALVHYAIYCMSATVGLVLIVIAFYNLYAINYHKCKHLVWHIQEKV